MADLVTLQDYKDAEGIQNPKEDARNRKAKFNYYFLEFMEAGIVLKGSEVKSLRSGKVNIAESYAFDSNGELFLINSHIPSYKESS